MSDAGEIRHDDDCLVISVDIADCPMAEIPLTEVFDISTMTLLENYHVAIRESVLHQLEDTTWLSEDLVPLLTDSGFSMYHARDRNSIISLRKPALQRLIIQRLKDRPRPSDVVYVPILIRFMMPGVDIPRPPGSSATSNSVHESRSRRSHAGPPSVIDTSVQVEVPAATEASRNEAIPAPPNVNVDVTPDPAVAAAQTFRGQPVDTRPTGGHGPPAVAAGRFQSPPDDAPPRPLLVRRRRHALERLPERPLVCIPSRLK
ncbi:hypothetical protein MHU86_12062 [Fragilaria crotonensis]|nr:hypothetical protein MHU86_12062 [Fragilaria crotonensis]